MIPIALEYDIEYSWKHSPIFCKIWMLADLNRFPLITFSISCLCAERIISRLGSVIPMKDKTVKIVTMLFMLLPWVLTACTTTAWLVSEKDHSFGARYCIINIAEEQAYDFFIGVLIWPLACLIVILLLMLMTYTYRGNNWFLFNDNESFKQTELLSFTWTVLTGIVCVCNASFLAPFTFFLNVDLQCLRDNCCDRFSSYTTFETTYGITMLTSSLTPYLWLILPDIRESIKTGCGKIREKLYSNPIQTHLSFSYHRE